MNHDKINYYNYKSRKADKEAIKRIQSANDTEFKKLDKNKGKNQNIKLSEMADDSLQCIKETLLTRLSSYNIEAFAIRIELKNIDRVLKLRKKPKLDD